MTYSAKLFCQAFTFCQPGKFTIKHGDYLDFRLDLGFILDTPGIHKNST